MKLREIEKTKIVCARKFFDEIGRRVSEDRVKYDVVASYEKPMENRRQGRQEVLR
jgi:type III restriction enzyme